MLLKNTKMTELLKLLFLETTIQGERVVGPDFRKEKISINIEGKTLISSVCVLGEFKQTFVHDAILFHKILVDSSNTSEALKRLPSFSARMHKRAVDIFASITEDGNTDKTDVLDTLERWILWELVHRFHYGLVAVVNYTNCRKARATVVKHGEKYEIDGLSCSKQNPPDCAILDFLKGHRAEFQQILDAIDKLPIKDKDQVSMVNAGQKVLEGQDTPFGLNCKALMDIVIALEAPKECAIYTTNKKHFEPVCKALGLNLYNDS